MPALPDVNRRNALLSQQRTAWDRGECPSIEALLADHPEAGQDRELLLDLIYADCLLRRARGEMVSVEEYVRRFPSDAESLKRLFEVDRILAEFSLPTSELDQLPPTLDWSASAMADPAQGAPAIGGGPAVDGDARDADGSTIQEHGADEARKPDSAVRQQPPQFGRYRVLKAIARGGMGAVFKAYDPQLERLVALKLIKSGELADAEQIQRFQSEAKVAAQLDHPGIVPVYEVGQIGGQHFMTMALVDGHSLWQEVKESPLAPKRAARLIQQVAEAVQSAHERGVVHRDLKPHNILLNKAGQPKVTDFGLAKRQGSDSSLTQTGQALGTPNFMPPEQAEGRSKQVGPLADVYSLGATLYCLLTGRPPFQAATQLETILQVVEQEPVSPKSLNREVPADLETICLKCLRKEPEKRYASALELARDLGRFLNGEPIRARAAGRLERGWRWCRRKPLAAGLVAAAAATCVLIMLGLWYRSEFIESRERLKAEVALRQITEFHATVNRIRQASAEPSHGWTWSALEDLARVAKTPIDGATRRDLETLTAEVLTRSDLRRISALAENVDAAALCFSRDGSRLAVGQRKDAKECSVQVYDVARRELAAAYTFSTASSSVREILRGDPKYHDGVAALAWSPDGRWLVAGTRFGRLVRWDTREREPRATVWAGHGEQPENRGREVSDLCFSPDGKTLFSARKGLKRWNAGNDWEELAGPDFQAHQFSLSPDGRFVILAGYETQAVQLLDAATLNPVSREYDEVAGAPAFSPDGHFVALSEEGGRRIVIREACSGAEVQWWSLQSSLRESLKLDRPIYAADGSALIVRDEFGAWHFCEPFSGREIVPALSTAADSPILVTSPGGPILAFNALGKRFRTELYEWKALDPVGRIPQPGTIRGLDFSPDGKLLAAASNLRTRKHAQKSRLMQWDAATGSLRKERLITYRTHPPVRGPSQLAWHPNGSRIAWYTDWAGLMVSPAAGSPGEDAFVPHPLSSLPFEIDAAGFAKSDEARNAQVRENPQVGRRMSVLEAGEGPGDRMLSLPIGSLPLQTNPGGWTLLASLAIPPAQPPESRFEFGYVFGRKVREHVLSLMEVPDAGSHWYAFDFFLAEEPDVNAKHVYVKTQSDKTPSITLTLDRAVLVPLASHEPRSPPFPCEYGAISWSPDGRALWGLSHDRKLLNRWAGGTLALQAGWTNTQADYITNVANIHSLAVGQRLVVCGCRNGSMVVLPAEGDLAPIASFQGPGGPIRALKLGPDDRWIAVGTETGKAEIRDLPSGSLLAELSRGQGAVTSIDATPDNKLLVTGGADGHVRLYDSLSWQPRFSLKTHDGPVDTIRLSHDGRRLAGFCRNSRIVLVWDLAALQDRIAEIIGK